MKDFWKKQAEQYKNDVKAVNFDPLAEELELCFLERIIKNSGNICDMGCGNGRLLLELGIKKDKATFYGIDFVKEMIEVAEEQKKNQNISNVNFFVADAASNSVKEMFGCKFDVVITKRLLINLKNGKKFEAIKNIYDLLKPKGMYIMVECFREPLAKINKIRRSLNIENIEIKSFNEYLEFNFLEKIGDLFVRKRAFDFNSLYYFTSRIYNAYLSQGQQPDYHAAINRLAVYLTREGFLDLKGYSPEMIFVFQKK